MTEKHVKVEVYVDTTNEEQVLALGSFLRTIGGMTVSGVTTKEEKAKTKPESKSKAKQEPKIETKTEPEPEVVVEPEPEIVVEPEPEPVKKYQIEEVREKLREKVSNNRELIKSKLTEFGAPNVSSLDPDKYPAFMEFLNSLE